VLISNSSGFTNSAEAMLTQNQVLSWGADLYGETNVPLDLTNVLAISGGWYHSIALKSDGTIVDWGSYASGSSFVPAIALSALKNVVAIAPGSDHDLAIVGSGPPLPQQLAVSPNWTNGVFSVSISTQSGRTYRLESCDSLVTGKWVGSKLVAGTGFLETLTDTNAAVAGRFYRVRRW